MTTTTARHLDEDDFARGLLELRNTLHAEVRLPVQVLFGHPMRSAVPAHHRSFAPEWQLAADDCDATADHLKSKAKARHDFTARQLPSLRLGAYVDVLSHASGRLDRFGVMTGIGSCRDYLVKMGSGRILRRNRKFLRPHHPFLAKSVPQSTSAAKASAGHASAQGAPPRTEPCVETGEYPAAPRCSCRRRQAPKRLEMQWGTRTYD